MCKVSDMTQRTKIGQNNINFETIACERYMSRLLQRELKEKPRTPVSANQKRERNVKTLISLANQPNKTTKEDLKQNFTSKVPNSRNVLEFTDDSALVEVTVKATNPRQRSKSTTVDREPWGQVLQRQKSNENIFGKFDPLRTLHFLAKELQYQLQTILPEDNSVQQILADIQDALKRVPPEVASTVHLQSALELLPHKRKSKSNFLVGDKLTRDQSAQTIGDYLNEDNEKFRKVMEESTLKLEESFKQMEGVCTKLKNEKEILEKHLQMEKDTVLFYKKRVEDLETENNHVLHPKIEFLEQEKQKLESDMLALKYKYETQSTISVTELKQQIADLNHSKTQLDQECSKLKHQIRLSTIEREKYIAVLSVRDRQISEIRKEMSQLQDVVNDQLLELHNNVYKSVPSSPNFSENNVQADVNSKENLNDVTISTIFSNEDQVQKYFAPKHNKSFQDLVSSDFETSEVFHKFQEYCTPEKMPQKDENTKESRTHLDKVEKIDSEASIRSMFNEVKKTAYAVVNAPKGQKSMNLLNIKK